ncbi:MAG: flavodoxin family protein [Candidatus Methanomethylicia archaeon]
MYTAVIVYDSFTGNTEKLAMAIAEGVKSNKNFNVIIKKVKDKFSLKVLNDADLIVLGSPTIYANVSPNIHNLLLALVEAVELGLYDLKGKYCAFFGSYGWDGARALNAVFTKYAKLIGLKVIHDGLFIVEHPSDYDIEKAKEFGATLASTFKK